MSTLRINNIEAQSVPASPTIDEKVKVTNSSGDILVNIDGKTSGITTIGINTTDGNIKFDANSNVLITGILTATTLAGNFTPDSLEIGSNIKLGNAGVITATSFVGNIVGGVTGNISIPESIVHTGDTNTRIAFIADETISFDTNGSEKLRITGAGSLITSNIGIGTDNRWKIRPNSGSEQLTFEYSTSPNLHDNNIKFRFASAGQLLSLIHI